MKVRSILALSDLSDACDAALHRAAEIALNHGAALRLLHFDESRRGDTPAALSRLGWKARRLGRLYGLRVAVADRVARRADDIRNEMAQADLLVTHHRERPRLRVPWRSSAVDTVLGLHAVALLVVKAAARRPYARVLAAVDLKDDATRLANWACAIGHGAEVQLLHVAQDPWLGAAALDPTVHAAEQRRRRLSAYRRAAELEAVMKSAAHGNCRMNYALVNGDCVAQAIATRQADHGAEVIVLGRSTGLPWIDRLLGTTARRVLTTVPSDLLVVPID